jgi:signal transduction histidine kinase
LDHSVSQEPDLQTIRRRRARRVLLAAGAVCGTAAVVWALLFALRGQWVGVVYEAVVVLFSLWVARLSISGSINRGAHVLFWAAVAIITGLIVLFDGPAEESPRVVHFFFLVLAVGIHFVFVEEDQRLVRTSYAALALIGFIIVETDLLSIPTVMPVGREVRSFAGVATVAGCMGFTLLLIRVFVADIAEAEARLNRLFSKTREALDRQTATAEILKVISSSPTDVHPVFEAITEHAARLFGRQGTLRLVDGGMLRRTRASAHDPGEFYAEEELPIDRNSLAGIAALERRPVQTADALACAPLIREDSVVGVLCVSSTAPGSLTEEQMALLATFADQAVIAIENARLFNEIQEKSAQLEIANKHKSEFLANMSHELRTPLNAIIGFSEVMIDKMFGELNQKQLEYQKDIHESGKHLLSLINDILDLSKIEAGRMELELSTFDLPSAVSNAVTLIRERAQRHGIALGVAIDQQLGEIQADERKVKQILLNLLSNAVKFTPDGGRVDVSARLDSAQVEIAVKDTGVGISVEDQASLFEEFKQLGKDSNRKAEGTGLGLALTRRLVELHGGRILVDSAPGCGSTFRVSLPLRC